MEVIFEVLFQFAFEVAGEALFEAGYHGTARVLLNAAAAAAGIALGFDPRPLG